jgi:hypothetical protein
MPNFNNIKIMAVKISKMEATLLVLRWVLNGRKRKITGAP